MTKACLRQAAMGFSLLVLPPLALAQLPGMQTMERCSSIVTGAGASVNNYCIGITKEALEHLNDIAVAGQGRRQRCRRGLAQPVSDVRPTRQ